MDCYLRPIRIAALVALLALAGMGTGCMDFDEGGLEEGEGTIVGVVSDSEGAPMADVTIYLRDDVAVATTSDSLGSFSLEEIPAGEHTLMAVTQTGLGAASSVVVFAHKEANAQMMMGPTGSIKGAVVLAGAATHGGVTVYVPGTSFVAMTDDSGAFQVFHVIPGCYPLRAEASGYQTASLAEVCVTAGEATETPTMTLAPLAQLACTSDADCGQGLVCSEGACEAAPGTTTEVCDGVDNDGDGTVDEGLVYESGTDVGACVPRVEACVGATVLVVYGGVEPTTEVCDDGIDNDCDGEVDDAAECGGFVCTVDEDCPQPQCGPCCVATCVEGTCQTNWIEPCCGNDHCETGEDATSCTMDCYCGNGTCEATEDAETCAADCAVTVCGDGTCGEGEDGCDCPDDCPVPECCADTDCPQPLCGPCCSAVCQAGTCTDDWLDQCCWNNVCEDGEDATSCPEDCFCGNGTCDDGETIASCAEDCTGCSCDFSSGVCEAAEDGSRDACPCDLDCQDGQEACTQDDYCDSWCGPIEIPASWANLAAECSQGELPGDLDCVACSCDTHAGSCEAAKNSNGCPCTCDADCLDGVLLPCSDDGHCDANCPAGIDPDCTEIYCGDGTCNGDEDGCSCPDDCEAPECCEDMDCPQPSCGPCCESTCQGGTCNLVWYEQCCWNEVCEDGEDATSCPQDCYCGNGTCDADESTATCPGDCPDLPTEGQSCADDGQGGWECAPGHTCFSMTWPSGLESHHCYLSGCAVDTDCDGSVIEDSVVATADYFSGHKAVCATDIGDESMCIGYSPVFFFEEGALCTDSLIMAPDYFCHDCGPLSMCLPDDYFDDVMFDDYPLDEYQMKCRRTCAVDSDCASGKCLLLDELTTDMYGCVLAPTGYCCLPGDQAPGCN